MNSACSADPTIGAMTPMQPTSSGARDILVLIGRHARHRHEVDAPAQRRLRLDLLVVRARVLHVQQQEFSARRFGDLRQAGNQKFPAEGAEHRLAGEELFLDWVISHGLQSPKIST